ncbi:hypothetical protein GUJ93_ZPchr0002g26787 [Zizania palustris]|uniref:Uncharacterized protein n=1 Tax=Zizania palustris TaxID=103762 RepID=A0A8J5VHB9_ZIZPA|nr:hypothetical protein GUJ93_ZPchr0002g26787 [Zizania palustris]
MPRHALAATAAKKPEEIAAPPAAESGKGAEKAEKKPKEAAKELEAESSEMKPEKDTAAPASAAPPPSTPPQARPTVTIGGFAFVPVRSLAADQPPTLSRAFVPELLGFQSLVLRSLLKEQRTGKAWSIGPPTINHTWAPMSSLLCQNLPPDSVLSTTEPNHGLPM